MRTGIVTGKGVQHGEEVTEVDHPAAAAGIKVGAGTASRVAESVENAKNIVQLDPARWSEVAVEDDRVFVGAPVRTRARPIGVARVASAENTVIAIRVKSCMHQDRPMALDALAAAINRRTLEGGRADRKGASRRC